MNDEPTIEHEVPEDEEDSLLEPGPWDWYLSPKIWLPGLGVLLLAVTAVAFGWWLNSDDSSVAATEAPVLAPDGTFRQPVHWHSDFALFIRGEQFNFAQDGFWSTEGEEKNPYVHIHEPRPTVVHVHREQTTWDEFLSSLGFSLTDNSLTLPDGTKYMNGNGETLKFFVNGTRIDTLMFQDIADLGKVLITFGPESADEVLQVQWPTVTRPAFHPSCARTASRHSLSLSRAARAPVRARGR
ncbi:hypothetical protein DCC78_02130 [bacterium]|nr:MAG: hypothetical protein DCC78_02130 [bacterium]